MTDTVHASTLDLVDPLLTGIARGEKIRASAFVLDGVLKPTMDAGVEFVQFSAPELGELGAADNAVGIEFLMKLLPPGFIQLRPRVAPAMSATAGFVARWSRAANTAAAAPDAASPVVTAHEPEVVYHFDLSMLRTATPGRVSSLPAYVPPMQSARAFQRTRSRRYG